MTTLPVGPLTFAANSEYDENFKEGTSTALGVGGGTLRVFNTNPSGGSALTGSGIYDTSVTPGADGNGGTGGTDANNDLSDFSVTSTINFQNRGVNSTVGYFLRLDGAESNGYLATVTYFNSMGTISLRFDLFKGVGIDYNPATSSNTAPTGSIFSETIAYTTAAATNYTYTVTANGSVFDFSVSHPTHGTATASYNDAGTTVITGQAGVFLRAQANNSTTRMDNIEITAPIPEPSSLLLLGTSGAFLFRRRRTVR